VNITTGKGDIRVAIVGVGNCANSLVQGVTYYKDAALDQEIPGLMHAVVGGYHINNVKFVAAFDVDAKKVGLDLAEAIWASENNTIKFSEVAKTGVPVLRGTTLDGLGKYYKETITESTAAPVDVVATLKEEQVDVLICYLPVGSEEAAKFYAQCALDAGCAFVNALPVFIASDPVWEKKFKDAGLPIVGDDLYLQQYSFTLKDGDLIYQKAMNRLYLHAHEYHIECSNTEGKKEIKVIRSLLKDWKEFAVFRD